MAAIGGSIDSATLDGRGFTVPFDTEVQKKLGGSENELQANGNGTSRLIKTVVSWSIDGLTVEIDDTRDDHEYLQGLADRNDLFPIAITYASGAVYQGTGQIVGDLQASSQSATASISLMGTGKLNSQ